MEIIPVLRAEKLNQYYPNESITESYTTVVQGGGFCTYLNIWDKNIPAERKEK